MRALRVLVTGGRDFKDRAFVFQALDNLREMRSRNLHIIQGGAEGADGLAREWALDRCQALTTYPANWREHGKGAGPIRNQWMLDDSDADIVVAFPGGSGTANMVRKTQRAEIELAILSPVPKTP